MNGASATSASPSGVQGICPKGWHVPSDAEWSSIITYASTRSIYQCGGTDTYIAIAMASTTTWKSSAYECGPGYDLSQNNTMGFSALPAGKWVSMSGYLGYTERANFWHTALGEPIFTISYEYGMPEFEYPDDAEDAYSVRCVYDSTVTLSTPTVTTEAPSSIDTSSMTLNGTLVSKGGATVTARGFCWSTSNSTPTIADSYQAEGGTSTGAYFLTITGLTSGRKYYVRAYVTSSEGTTYGTVTTITTPFLCGINRVTDYAGNSYTTVQMGTQCWMKQNLRTPFYADGTAIPVLTTTGTSITKPYYYHVASDASNDATRGLLYNWKAVMNGSASSNASPSGVQGVCPDGWHVPSYAEMTTMMNYVNSIEAYRCGGTDQYIAQALSGSLYWASTNTLTECMPAKYPASHNNATGFSAVPAGRNGISSRIGKDAALWSCTHCVGDSAYVFRIDYAQEKVNWQYDSIWDHEHKRDGWSVRCILNEAVTVSAPTVTTAAISGVGPTIATAGGTVTSIGGSGVTERGVCYSTTNSTPTISDTKVVSTVTYPYSTTFTNSLTGLTSEQTYYLRAYATNSAGTAYGNVVVFTTSAIILPKMSITVNTAQSPDWGKVTIDSTDATSAEWRNSNNVVIGSWISGKTSTLPVGTYTVTYTNANGTSTKTFVVGSTPTCVVSSFGANETGTTISGVKYLTSLSDEDGNTYQILQIGTQCWMRDNLRTTEFSSGNSISDGTYSSTSSSTPYYYYPNYAVDYYDNKDTYGLLYNYAAVATGELCPTGWHVPSISEWQELRDYVASVDEYKCNADGMKIAKALAATSGWDTNSGGCTVGDDLSANNATGFSAMPAGYYSAAGYFRFGKNACYLSSTAWSMSVVDFAEISYNSSSLDVSGSHVADYGNAVRCVRDEE